MSKLRIILADDHKIMREGLRMLVNAQADMEVVGEADNGRMAITLTQELKPDVVVMDVSMPELNGLRATEKLKELFPGIKVLTLTRHMDEGYLKQLLEAGASGYVLKQSASEELVRAIHAVVNGQTYLDPAMMEQFVGNVIGRRAARGSPAKGDLSPREEEVLRLIAWGHLSKEVAARLQISIKTVEAHKTNGMQKLGMKSRIDLVHYALLQGWLKDT
ncbi:MAG TPA: response regulator transcription factor [Pyrinomonadaceae bacterium]|jgi:DNA-binding NarL/FixJ family response regulator|nr:response regulator transcription factor [Pyrinomonadaceae bacterium]